MAPLIGQKSPEHTKDNLRIATIPPLDESGFRETYKGTHLIDSGGTRAQGLRLYLVVPGILLALAGFVFTLQGLGIVGPTSSFMFQSSAWIYQGLAVFFLGLFVTIGGLWKSRSKTSG